VKPLASHMTKPFVIFAGIRSLLCGHAARRTRNLERVSSNVGIKSILVRDFILPLSQQLSLP